ncbi:MAG: DUF4294 domain-containing protein [Saprospiraceae bacterium]
MKNILLNIICLLLSVTAFGQTSDESGKSGQIKINGEILTWMIDDSGDTLLLASLDEMSISSPRKFENRNDYRRYQIYKRYALKVYPYAAKAIRIFRETEYATETMNKRKRKKYIKKLQKELHREFEEPLKKLTKTQGKIMVKMIEKELDVPMYSLIRDLRGGFTATYWSTFARLYGHRLKDGYTAGEDQILDAVLNDLDISYEVKKK